MSKVTEVFCGKTKLRCKKEKFAQRNKRLISFTTISPPFHSLQKTLDKMEELSPWLFPSSDDPDNHIGRIRAHNILTEAFQNVGIEEASTHSMRRTCLTNMSRAGIPLRTIQEISGHSNLGQLQEYLAVDPADSHRAIMSLKY